MSRKQTIKIHRPDVELRYSNWFAQVINMIAPKNLYIIAGRGTSKTVDIQAERMIDFSYDLPGAPLAFVSDTYMNLHKNVLASLIDGLEIKGWRYGEHFVIEEKPPSHFLQSHNRFLSYKHTLITHTGLNYTMVSLDRPSAAAGRSYVHLQGDEVKYFPEEKIAKLTKTVRGFQVKYGRSPFYRGHTFTTDMPNPNNVGEHDWLLKMMGKMNKSQILLILQCAFILNEIKQEFIIANDSDDKIQIRNAIRKLERWEDRYRKVRRNSTLFLVASSFVNADILTEDYFRDEFDASLEDIFCALLSMYPKLQEGLRFYPALADHHFFDDGYLYDHYDKYSLRERITETSLGLRHIRHDEHLEGGADFGNMNSLYIGQEQGNIDRGLKFLYTLPKEWIPELGKKFREFFQPHKKKLLKLRYDRAGNNYNEVNEDMAGKIKKAIEYDQQGKPSGWIVQLESRNQSNVTHQQEYDLCIQMMSETNNSLPKLLIDKHNCREVKSSLENAPATKDEKENIKKNKKSEKLPIHDLPMRSTNPSDAFKYYICKPQYLKLLKTNARTHTSPLKVRGRHR